MAYARSWLGSTSITTARLSFMSVARASRANSPTTAPSRAIHPSAPRELPPHPAQPPPAGPKQTSCSACPITSAWAPEAVAACTTVSTQRSLRMTGTFVPTSRSIFVFDTTWSPHPQSPHSESSLRDSAQRHLRWRHAGPPNHNARSGFLQLPRFRLHHRNRYRTVAALLLRSWHPRLRSKQHSSRSLAAIQRHRAASIRQLLHLPDQLRRPKDRPSDDDRSDQSEGSADERHHLRQPLSRPQL